MERFGNVIPIDRNERRRVQPDGVIAYHEQVVDPIEDIETSLAIALSGIDALKHHLESGDPVIREVTLAKIDEVASAVLSPITELPSA